jgi:hypothetical protein
VEKDQVTFAVQAHGLTGPLGHPILVCCIAREGDMDFVVCLRLTEIGMTEVRRYPLGYGPVNHWVAEEVSVLIGDDSYFAIARIKGVQDDLELPLG